MVIVVSDLGPEFKWEYTSQERQDREENISQKQKMQ